MPARNASPPTASIAGSRNIDFDAREIERNGIVVVADVALHAGDVARAFHRINIRHRNDLRVRNEIAVNSEMRAAHETETDQSDSYGKRVNPPHI